MLTCERALMFVCRSKGVFLLRVTDGSRFHLLELRSGRVSKPFNPHPKRVKATFAVLYNQTQPDNRSLFSSPRVFSHLFCVLLQNYASERS